MLTAAQKKSMKKYRQSEKGRIANKRYRHNDKGKEAHRILQHKYDNTIEGKLRLRAYGLSKAGKECLARTMGSINGVLYRKYMDMKARCEYAKHPSFERYNRKGIKVKFKSLDDFRDYVTNELKVDPRGKHIHRIDNDGHYECGNIEFLTREEHVKKHINI